MLEDWLYPGIAHKESSEALRQKLEEEPLLKSLSNNCIDLAEFDLKNNYVELRTATATKFSPPYTRIHMDKHSQTFLKTKICSQFYGFIASLIHFCILILPMKHLKNFFFLIMV